MALKSQITVWSPPIGDVVLGSAQAGAIGASFGNGAATAGANPLNPLQLGDDGNLVVDNPSVGRSPSATGADKILSLMTVPANAFDIANRGINIMAAGNAPNTDARTIKIIVNPTTPTLGATVSGGTTIATLTNTGAQSGASGGWNIQANIFKYGAAGSNTQNAIHESGQIGSFFTALTAPSQTTFPENAPIVIAITGNATTTATDVVLSFAQIFAMN
jgi:hypothetical protein